MNHACSVAKLIEGDGVEGKEAASLIKIYHMH